MASRAAHCRYDEEGCYRENPDHFHEFRHEPERSMHETMARLCDKFVVLGFSPQSVHAVLEHQHGHYESTERLLVEELSRREAQGQHDVLVRGAHSSRTRVDPPANSFIEALPATATGNPEERRLAAHGSTGLTPSTVADPQPCHHQDKGGLACVVSATSGETRTRQATCPGATSAMTPSHAPPAQGPKDSVPPSVVRAPLQLPCPAPGDGPLSPPTVAATAEPNRRTDEQRTMSEKPTGVSSRSPPRYSRECEAGAGAPPEFAIVRATTRALQEAGVGGGAGAAAQPNSAPPPPATVQRPSNSVVRAPRQPQRPAPGDGPSPLTLGGAVTQGHTPPLASLPAAHHLRLSFSLFLSLPHTHTHTWMFPSPTTSAHSRGPLQLLSAVLYLWRELGIRREEEKAANEVVAGRAQPATDPSPRQLPLRSGKAAHPAQAPFVFPSPVCVRVCVRVEKKKTRRGGKRRRRRRREWAKCVWCV